MPADDTLDRVRAFRWSGDALELLDQRALPGRVRWLRCEDAPAVARGIRDMVVRGAPAIGIAAAFAVVLAARRHGNDAGSIAADLALLREARPTAVNLGWALDRMRGVLATGAGAQRLLAEAEAIAAEDLAANRRMAKLGADALQPGVRVLTICNTGSLATAGLGTALGVIREAHRRGWLEAVYACETRPANQGARLTLWELSRDGIPASLIVDSAAAALMASGRVDWVITGADRITANGDVINKIGTYALALAAHVHGVRTMVVAPSSSLDPDTATGSQVVIEERPPGEIQAGLERAWNPVFDCTPVALVDCIVTERGCLVEPARTGLAGLSRGAAN